MVTLSRMPQRPRLGSPVSREDLGHTVVAVPGRAAKDEGVTGLEHHVGVGRTPSLVVAEPKDGARSEREGHHWRRVPLVTVGVKPHAGNHGDSG